MECQQYNAYMHYDTIHMWNRGTWETKISPFNHLIRWMAQKEKFSCCPVTHSFPEAEISANFNKSRHCYVYPHVTAHYQELGYGFEIGGLGWVVFAPLGEEKRPRPGRKTLIVMCDTDKHDSRWVMNLLAHYRKYCEMAIADGSLVIFIAAFDYPRVDLTNLTLMEAANTFNLLLDEMYFDLSSLTGEMPDLSAIPCQNGTVSFAEPVIVEYGTSKIPTVKISGEWFSEDSMEFANFTPGRIGDVDFCYERLIHSTIGKRMADAMLLEYENHSPYDPDAQAHLARLGLVYQEHTTMGRRWVALYPESILEQPCHQLPCMFIMQEILPSAPHTVLSAFSLWYEYLNLASRGEMMLIFFALETPDANDVIADILRDAEKNYSFLDSSRIYLTGHSHNGQLALEFASRFPMLLAGVAPMGRNHGLRYKNDAVYVSDRLVESLRNADMPTININGQFENGMSNCIPITNSRHADDQTRIASWQLRLQSCNCPLKSPDEILSAPLSTDLATRMLGVPVDRTEIVYFESDPCYIGDVYNNEDQLHFRIVTIDNLCHATSAHMPGLTWSFLRQFRRNPATGEIENLFR